ncbi:MAG TPA: aminotransferase class I/II-fold pyridoxal phosphate-dependent enzyme [Chthonomonadales bacterium]|nr:aminotransferase class I/II-fold pyridoxal phosphate-dependent enzyme [Chthonomonadales bacterium]
MKSLNHAVLQTPPSGIRRFFDVASQMPDAISLGVGEPDFVTPWRIREAGIDAIERGYTTYTSNAGLMELREAVACDLESRYGVSFDPSAEILITVGVSEGLDLALRALVNPGDEVIHFEPGYVSYVPGIRFVGGAPVAVRTSADDGFRIRPEALAAAVTPRTKAILLAYPNNPTGGTLSRDDVAAVVRLAVEHDLYLVTDEIYSRLTYGGEHTCAASVPGARERTVVLNGFSKAYAMTGWRVGYVCAPPPVAESILKLHQYTMLCAPHMSQKAAVEALRHGEAEVRRMVSEYDRRRRFFVRGLNAIGLACHEPLGAFYAFPSIRSTGLSSEEFSTRLLHEARVAVVPGNAFGETGEGHVRCSYATSMPKLEQALDRMARFVQTLSRPGHTTGEERALAAHV